MNIVLRVDSSITIGTGHVMRCLTLADLLREKDAQVFFVCVDLMGSLIGLIKQKGYSVLPINVKSDHTNEIKDWDWEIDAAETFKQLQSMDEPIDCLIIDHYGLDLRWEKVARDHCKKVMVIDDLANRAHDCDILLDQNYYRNKESRYVGLVPYQCQQFLGPSYALLRTEFTIMKRNELYRNGKVKRILIFFGGSDPTNETMKTLDALKQIDVSDIPIDVVVGASNPNKEAIRLECLDQDNMYYHEQVDNMAELMAKADLAIGAGGVTMWERCYLGLPTIVIIVADNQRETTQAVAEFGAIWNLGWHTLVTPTIIADTINRALNSPHALKEMSFRAFELINHSDDSHDTGLEALVKSILKEN